MLVNPRPSYLVCLNCSSTSGTAWTFAGCWQRQPCCHFPHWCRAFSWRYHDSNMAMQLLINKRPTLNWHRYGRLCVLLLATAWWCWSGIQAEHRKREISNFGLQVWQLLGVISNTKPSAIFRYYLVASEIGTCWMDHLAHFDKIRLINYHLAGLGGWKRMQVMRT